MKPVYAVEQKQYDDIVNRFTYHPPKEGQAARYSYLRDAALELAMEIARQVPPGREQSLALTHLEECIMFANAGIARGE